MILPPGTSLEISSADTFFDELYIPGTAVWMHRGMNNIRLNNLMAMRECIILERELNSPTKIVNFFNSFSCDYKNYLDV